MVLEELLVVRQYLQEIKQHIGGLNQKLQIVGKELIVKVRRRKIDNRVEGGEPERKEIGSKFFP
jgi:hypothetical protein